MIVIITGEQASGKSRLAKLLEDGYNSPFTKLWKIDPVDIHVADNNPVFDMAFLDAMLRFHRNEGLVIMVLQGSLDEVQKRVNDQPMRGWGGTTSASLWKDIREVAQVFELVRLK